MLRFSVFVLLVLLLLGKAVVAQDTSLDASESETREARYAMEVKRLNQIVLMQQEQIRQLQESLQKISQRIESLSASQATAPVSPRSDDQKSSARAVPLWRNTPASAPESNKPLSVAGPPALKPPAEESASSRLFSEKLSIGGLVFGDYAAYYKTGFGPQFLTQINPPGPGNNGYNSFDITRAFINVMYSPSDALTFRITPNIYRQIGITPGRALGASAAAASSTDSELSYRLKYAYADFNTLFSRFGPLKDSKLTLGQQPNVLVDWEENLYGFRFVNLTPWNYLSLSSAQAGAAIHGPAKIGGMRLDYGVGVYNNGSFHSLELSERKQAMARLSLYPFSATSAFGGLGLTGFYDYGYSDVTPDTPGSYPIYRIAALAHFNSKSNAFGIAGEYDRGRNAFTSGNLFSGSGPADEFGLGPTPFGTFDSLARSLLNYNGTKQQGFALFGHAAIPRSRLMLFGMYEYFQPNITISRNPLDFARIVAGVSYRFNEHLRLSLNSQNLLYTHNQFTFPQGGLAGINPTLAGQNPGGIANAVPTDTRAIFLNLEFSFNKELLFGPKE